MHESFGFVREALLREHIVKDDGVHDVVMLSMLHKDWLSRRDVVQERLSSGLPRASSR
jgi:hypothetical protein